VGGLKRKDMGKIGKKYGTRVAAEGRWRNRMETAYRNGEKGSR